jgi:hypothetical protein
MTDEPESAVRIRHHAGFACIRPADPISLVDREDALVDAFLLIRGALDERNEAVVVTVDDRQLQGRVETASAALAHGLLGLVRALAIEGRKEGWNVNMLAVTPGVSAEQERAWIERLAEPGGASGTVIRLGDDHLGRLSA